jgi:hypothetical protein
MKHIVISNKYIVIEYFVYRQISKLSERVRTDSENTGSHWSLQSASRDKEVKGDPSVDTQVADNHVMKHGSVNNVGKGDAAAEEEKEGDKPPTEKDKLIQAEAVETGRVRCFVMCFCFFVVAFFVLFVCLCFKMLFFC